MRRLFLDLSRYGICLLLVIVLGLPAFELLMRTFTHPPYTLGYLVTHPTRHFELNPNFAGYTYEVPFKINSLGMRDDDRAVRPEAFRILVLGDSISFGPGVPQDRLYPKLLESRLNEQPAPRPAQVFNLAQPGYNFAQEWDLLREKIGLFKPDLILFQFSLQDDTVLADLPGESSSLNRIASVRKFKDTLRNLYSYNIVAGRIANIRKKLTLRKPAAHAQASRRTDEIAALYDSEYPGWIETRKGFGELALLSRRERVPVVVAIFSDYDSIAPDTASDEWRPLTSKLQNALRENGLEHSVVVTDFLREYSGRERLLQVKPTDHHLSPLGHQLVADALLKYLRSDKLIPVEDPHARP